MAHGPMLLYHAFTAASLVEIDNRKIIVEKKYCISDVFFTVQYNGLFIVE
jgi:hypothetical protein